MSVSPMSSTKLFREFAMAHSVQPYFVPHTASAGSAADRASGKPRNDKRRMDGSRPLAGMLLAAVVAALLVVADQLIETWADGHLLVVWVALWTVAFAALALLASPLRQLAAVAAVAITRWSEARAARRADAAMLRVAEQDYRVMRDLQLASLRSDYEA